MSETATAAVTSRVIVGVRDSAKGRAQLRQAAAEARRKGAELVPVLAWSPTGGELQYRAHPCPELAHAWEQRACAKLDQVVSTTLASERLLPSKVRPVTVLADSLSAAVTATATGPADEVFTPSDRPNLLTRFRGVALAH